jgi:prepilin-type N-terminal cleavage/methylation domain-containing protein
MNNCKARRARKHLQGFTLIEVAMVLVIVGLMMGGIMGALGPQLDNKKVRDTQERIKQASEAIMAFAIANRRLPCPASATSNGDEVFTGVVGACSNFNDGFVPARTLGLGERGLNGVMQDGWGFGIRYAVTQVTYTGLGNAPVSINCSAGCYPFTQPDGVKNAYFLNGAPGVQPLVANLLQVCASSTGATATTAVTCGAPADLVVRPALIVWSTARNGGQLGGGSGADEAVNLNGNSVFVTHSRAETGATNGAFDDILQWQTVASVFQDMIKMGILP